MAHLGDRSILDDPTQFPESWSFTSQSSKLYPTAWCPKLDVFVLVTRIAERNHLVLRSFRETSVWDHEFDASTPHPEISCVRWSPDSLAIVVAHGGARITFHSLHDGALLKSIPLAVPEKNVEEERLVSNLWWVETKIPKAPTAFKDVFNRTEIPGTAHSVLRLLPRIEHVLPDLSALKAGVGFQRPPMQAATRVVPPEKDPLMIPSSSSDLFGASIAKAINAADLALNLLGHTGRREDYTFWFQEVDRSLLIVGDTWGYLHFFLDGFYPLGYIHLGTQCSPVSVYAPPLLPFNVVTEPAPDLHLFAIATLETSGGLGTLTNSRAASLKLPLLHQQITRDVVRASTTIKELLVFAASVLHEMEEAWMGTESREGARGLGAKWLRHLENILAAHGDATSGDALLDLTVLLLTGKGPPSIREFFSSGGRLSERALSHWETTMGRTLKTLQEFAERKLVPTLERLVVVLEQVQGWTQKYKLFHLREADIVQAVKQVLKAIEFSEWLSKEAENELHRYFEFAKWFKSESIRANDGSGNELRAISFDPLEALEYLENGLTSSTLDRWFTGPIPPVSPSDVIAQPFDSVKTVIATARSFLNKKSADAQSPRASKASSPEPSSREASGSLDVSVTENDLDQAEAERTAVLAAMTDRNLVSLLEDIIEKCQGILITASGAVVRSAEVNTDPLLEGRNASESRIRFRNTGNDGRSIITHKERIIETAEGVERYIALRHKQEDGIHVVYLLKTTHPNWDLDQTPSAVIAHVMQCRTRDIHFELLDYDFFDDFSMVMLLRAQGAAYLTHFDHTPAKIPYQPIEGMLPATHRETWVLQLSEAVQNGQIPAHDVPRGRTRRLEMCSEGSGYLAVNGAQRRQVACILDERGHGQVFDMMLEDQEEEIET
ncbi:anaphase-promoting complex, cyclosome, subunit 4-domain-containing protein [Cantharellus anzutake]|uniref:anaphase-promoting complex, cyclosome, subunit 4-domain-containing protein n=1 Tax=Cantharellus anzutake TaxID=1750568 RepID=UPI001907D9B2|nr:anaphase-promoting complex, cyclosome, subunit 4-domain-containing protein [Cantharellus anzutake]KAF8337366.1 anaphase-promoting complex, cyclosome, subunit 4-domain-containing protein [Cantharellus anzutake]